MTRRLIGVGLLIAMLAFGLGVYHAAGYLRGQRNVVHRPTEVSAPSLPGTIYLVQNGAIYRFQHGNFTQITSASGWMQPSPAPNNQLVAVRRQGNYSDLYLLSTATGKTVGQLTHDSSTRAVENNHWVFYPRLSRDGQTLFYAYDQKDGFGSYRVDLAIFATPLDPSRRATVWTRPNEYTGGDVDPVPLGDGGLIYTKYSNDDSFQVHSQIWIQRRAGSPGVALTPVRLGCHEPAVSPDEKLVAMVCNRWALQPRSSAGSSSRRQPSPPTARRSPSSRQPPPAAVSSSGPSGHRAPRRCGRSRATSVLTPTPRRAGSPVSATVEFKNRPMVVVAEWLDARFGSRRRMVRFRTKSDAPDLHSQLESILDQVWRSESDWRLWDRLDAAVTLETLREKRLKRRDQLDKAA